MSRSEPNIPYEHQRHRNRRRRNPHRLRPKCINFAPEERYNYFRNPYSYGAKQYDLGPLVKTSMNFINDYERYKLPHKLPHDMHSQYPDCWEENFNGIRNISVENSLLHRTFTHIPGQRSLTETDFDRFNLLPFDPQDTRHIVWKDNMPRSGYSTRSDRLDYCFEEM